MFNLFDCVPRDVLALAVFVAACLGAAMVASRILQAQVRRWLHRRASGNVILHDFRAVRPNRPNRRPGLRLPRVHPLAWLIGIAVLFYGFENFFPTELRPGGQVLRGIVTHIRDGDTIEVARVPVRFSRLDCAELGTDEGERAKRRMVELANGKAVVCRLSGRQSYDRMVGDCKLADGRDLASVMVSEGYCGRWW